MDKIHFGGYGHLHSVDNLSEHISLPSGEDIKIIPQFFKADFDMVYRLGGPLLKYFIDIAIKRPGTISYKYLSIDTRVHMLMPGWYPCIPGWHCDMVPRDSEGQPDFSKIEQQHSEHFAVVVGNTSFTEFVVDELLLSSPEELRTMHNNKPIYGLYNNIIENMKPQTKKVENGEIVKFTPYVFHRGTPASKPGWRLFARITFSDHVKPKNEIRTQTQVYLTDPNVGW